jgi:hypothetical protein
MREGEDDKRHDGRKEVRKNEERRKRRRGRTRIINSAILIKYALCIFLFPSPIFFLSTHQQPTCILDYFHIRVFSVYER